MKKLKKYLAVNSFFSGACGVAMLVLPGQLNLIFNIRNENVVPLIGLNLIAFSGFVWYVLRKQLTNKIIVNVITGLDVLWVLGSFIIIALRLFDLSEDGNVLIGIVALWISFLSYKQFQYNK
jgi:hypothetical protein